MATCGTAGRGSWTLVIKVPRPSWDTAGFAPRRFDDDDDECVSRAGVNGKVCMSTGAGDCWWSGL